MVDHMNMRAARHHPAVDTHDAWNADGLISVLDRRVLSRSARTSASTLAKDARRADRMLCRRTKQ